MIARNLKRRHLSATPHGVEATHEAFLCPFECTQGWITIRMGLTRFKPVRCDCDRDECAPAGYVSEMLCDCDAVLTPETTRGLDGPLPLCAECMAERIKPETHPVIQSVSDTVIPKVA